MEYFTASNSGIENGYIPKKADSYTAVVQFSLTFMRVIPETVSHSSISRTLILIKSTSNRQNSHKIIKIKATQPHIKAGACAYYSDFKQQNSDFSSELPSGASGVYQIPAYSMPRDYATRMDLELVRAPMENKKSNLNKKSSQL